MSHSPVRTVRAATFDLLRDLQITTVFGNPGSTEETFLKEFPADFRYVHTLAEASAVGAADGYAQITRRPALVNVHTAAGLSNAMSNIMTASMNRTPLIITAGNQTREMLLMEPWLTNVEPTELPKPWVKWSYEPVRADDVPAAFMRAYAMATQAPAGPVFLSVPLDDWDQPFDGEVIARSTSTRYAPDPDRMAEFASRLSAAKNPAFIFGAAVARGEGWEHAVRLAEKLEAPVWAAPASERAPFPEDHRLYRGGLPFAIGPLSEKLDGHDLAIVIGAPVFRYYPYVAGDYLPAGLTLLHVSDDPSETAKAPVGDSTVGDAVLAIDALIDLVHVPASRATRDAIEAQPHRLAPHPPATAVSGSSADATPLTAQRLFDVLREVSPPQTVLVEESPSNLAELHTAWPVVRPDSFFTMASGSLGFSLPAAVGIALAERERDAPRPVLAVIGDGSLQYSVQALWTAARERLPLVVVVPCNAEYAILKAFADLEQTPGVPGLDIAGIDTAGIARGYGCTGVDAATEDDVRAAVDEAWKRPGPTVIAVPIQPTVPPLV
ncbi:benzoylformate decarboxylase [Microbacterium koreense]|uniref:Benzoylformate decarboxylase n=1 Tax=Microbacterium koreense TaxID=323761 RepID=A0ABW2ZRD3_9MICO